MDSDLKKIALTSLKKYMDSFYFIDDESWSLFLGITRFKMVEKGEKIFAFGDIPASFFYIYKGLFRAYIINDKGEEFNKNFFQEYFFFGPMSPLMFSEPINFEIEALEDGVLIQIDNKKYRELLAKSDSLKLFYIEYLEKRLQLSKKIIEESRMQDDAITRYLKFLNNYLGLENRLSQYHIASYLGITPTHLSRIRKKINLGK